MKHNKLIEAIRLILNGSGDIELVRDAVNLLLDELEDIEETLAEEEEYKELEKMAENFEKYREKKELYDKGIFPMDTQEDKGDGLPLTMRSGHTWDG